MPQKRRKKTKKTDKTYYNLLLKHRILNSQVNQASNYLSKQINVFFKK